MPIRNLFEEVMRKVMVRLMMRRKRIEMWPTNIPSKVHERITQIDNWGKTCRVIYGDGLEYEVMENGNAYLVNLNANIFMRNKPISFNEHISCISLLQCTLEFILDT